MNKGLTGIILSVLSSAVILSACSEEEINTRSQIDNTRQIDNYSGITMEEVESMIHDKLDQDIDIEKDINAVDLDGDGSLEYVVKYKSKDKDKPLKIIILSVEDDKLVVKDEIGNVGEEFDEVKYIDITNDGKTEILAGFKAGEKLSKGISIYNFNNGKASEIFEEYYSEYIVKDINDDSKKDIIIIKDKEKEDKSYAYLYVCQNDKFEKIKKVEIDSTLDTKDEIIKKLLED